MSCNNLLHGSHGEDLRGIDLLRMSKLSAEGMTIGVVSAKWQACICENLVQGIKEAVEPAGGKVIEECTFEFKIKSFRKDFDMRDVIHVIQFSNINSKIYNPLHSSLSNRRGD